jgi:hypothetical protein
MGMETLQSAARAAGFAMAPSDEADQQAETGAVERSQWRPAEAMLVPSPGQQQPGKAADLLRGLFSYFGRRAPASPA